MAKRKLIVLFGSILILLLAVGYVYSTWVIDVPSNTPEGNNPNNSTSGDNPNSTDGTPTNVDDPSDGIPSNPSDATMTLTITPISGCNENDIKVHGATATLTSAGTYSISGTLEDGQVIVDTDDEDAVTVILEGVNISCSTNAPIHVEKAVNTFIVLAEDTENYLTDNENNDDDAALFSEDDLTLYGNGSLTVSGNANDAIRSNDGLVIKSGKITVTSVDDGIYGKDYLLIEGGDITVVSVGDGLKSENVLEEDKGYIVIEDGKIKVTSTLGDAVTAQTNLSITSGTFTLTSGGGSGAVASEGVSTKGLKAGVSVVIDGGDFTIDSYDDGIHSNDLITINDGTYSIASGDDGMHADNSLEINGGIVDIVQSYEGLESAVITINSGYLQVDSDEDGISGKDCLVINGGHVKVVSVGDGLKSDSEEAGKGYVSIEDSIIDVTSTRGDAITAQTDLLIISGTFTLKSGGGSNAGTSVGASTKGLKAGVSVVIADGDFTIDSYDDGIHSNDLITINDGTYSIASGDDGIHADTSVEINNGVVDIVQCFEGIESEVITVNNGYIQVVADDDGFNAVGGDGGSTGGGMWPGGGGGMFPPPGDYYIYINGGYIYIDSDCDGLDSDGYIEMTGGVVIVNGPVPGSAPNGAIDYGEGSFTLTGGTLVAVGSSDMTQGPGTSSTQYSVIATFRSQQSANTLVNIQTASGQSVLTFRPTKAYQSLVFSSPALTTGSYELYLGGSATGTSSNGLYEGGTYTPGTLYNSFTISTIVTTISGGGGGTFPWF